MLFAVEGGGFFSSSASGYSKGLTLLLLGHKDNKKPMRVIPWNQNQPVDQEANPDIQLDTGKTLPPVRRCACFVCFGRDDAAGDESPPTQNVEVEVELPQNQESLPENLDFGERKDQTHPVVDVNGGGIISKISSLKSSLKKSADSPRDDVANNGSVHEVNSSSSISGFKLKSSLKKSADSPRVDVTNNGSVHEINSSSSISGFKLKSSLKKSADSPRDDVTDNGSVHDVNSSSIISGLKLKSSLKKSADSPRDDVNDNGSVHEVNSSSTISSLKLKSSLNKSADSPQHDINGSGSVHEVKSNEDEALQENGNEITSQAQRRVQWIDTNGGELSEIREFEMSEDSDDEFEHRTRNACSCRIM